MFTLPKNIQLEIRFGEPSYTVEIGRSMAKLSTNWVTVDKFDLIIPGGHVKSLTSASKTIKEYEFSQKELLMDQKLRSHGTDLRRDTSQMSAKEKAQVEQELKTLDQNNRTGTVFVKAEWSGWGHQMPPARSETLFQMKKSSKNRNYYTKEEQIRMLQE